MCLDKPVALLIELAVILLVAAGYFGLAVALLARSVALLVAGWLG